MKKDNALNYTIGKNIKLFREKNNFTQEEVAKFIDITQEEMSYIENSKREIRITVLDRLSNLFNIPMKYFLMENTTDLSDSIMSFRSDKLDKDTLDTISLINKFASNYINLRKIIDE